MAMNKKELAEMEALKTKLALHFYPSVEPDIEPQNGCSVIVNGWYYNAYSKRVEKACTSSVSHSFGKWDKTSSQLPMRLFSSRKLAYMALLSEMANIFASELREVEKRMEIIE